MGGYLSSPSTKSEELVEHDSETESESESDDENDSELVTTSVFSQLTLTFGPTVAWGWKNMGTFGWFASSTCLVMVMPLIFEVEREAMMKEMMQQQQAQAAQQQAGTSSTIAMPAPGSLPSV